MEWTLSLLFTLLVCVFSGYCFGRKAGARRIPAVVKIYDPTVPPSPNLMMLHMAMGGAGSPLTSTPLSATLAHRRATSTNLELAVEQTAAASAAAAAAEKLHHIGGSAVATPLSTSSSSSSACSSSSMSTGLGGGGGIAPFVLSKSGLSGATAVNDINGFRSKLAPAFTSLPFDRSLTPRSQSLFSPSPNSTVPNLEEQFTERRRVIIVAYKLPIIATRERTESNSSSPRSAGVSPTREIEHCAGTPGSNGKSDNINVIAGNPSAGGSLRRSRSRSSHSTGNNSTYTSSDSDNNSHLGELSDMPRTSTGGSWRAARDSVAADSSTACVSNARWTVRWDDSRTPISNMRSLPENIERVWVGWPGVDVPENEREEFSALLEDMQCYAVYLPEDLRVRFFDRFCKGVLWPLFHYKMPNTEPDYGKNWDEVWQAYTNANMLYSKVASCVLEDENDDIWIHNYHLLVCPSFLRKKLPRVKIGIFIHTPWPTSDIFRCLPARVNLLRGILCSDLIGFHTYDYARHFLSCCKRVLDLDVETVSGGSLRILCNGRSVCIRISHVGISSDVFLNAMQNEIVKQKVANYRQEFAGRKVIVGVDDLDLFKGTLLKLQGFERFLSTFPEFRSSVVFVQVLLSSSNSAQEKQQVRDEVMNEVEVIQNAYGHDVLRIIEPPLNENKPLHDQENISTLPLFDLLSLYQISDCGFMSTFWDGLNLAPYEYTASQTMEHPGSLILSEFMGCSRSLSGVVRVNPWKLEEVSEALRTALTMSLEERQVNFRRRYKYVMNHTSTSWAFGFLHDLNRASDYSKELNLVQVGWGSNVCLIGLRTDFSHLDVNELAAYYRASPCRILMFDYDGTLTAETDRALCAPSSRLLSLLSVLCADPHNIVFILSGRERKVLALWFGDVPFLGLAAEKGCYVHWPGSDCWTASEKIVAMQAPSSTHSVSAPGGSACLSPGETQLPHDSTTDSDTAEGPGVQAYTQPQENGTVTAMDSTRVRGGLVRFSSDSNPPSSTSTPANGRKLRRGPPGTHDSRNSEAVPGRHSADTVVANGNGSTISGSASAIVAESPLHWKQEALSILRSYTERTDGSYIEDKETAVVWHYENADIEYGKMQATELAKFLQKVLAHDNVDVVRYDHSRILEVKPQGISKGVTTRSIINTVIQQQLQAQQQQQQGHNLEDKSLTTPLSATSVPSIPPPLILCIGDDRSDEEMFTACHMHMLPRASSGSLTANHNGTTHIGNISGAGSLSGMGVGHDTPNVVPGSPLNDNINVDAPLLHVEDGSPRFKK